MFFIVRILLKSYVFFYRSGIKKQLFRLTQNLSKLLLLPLKNYSFAGVNMEVKVFILITSSFIIIFILSLNQSPAFFPVH